MDEERKEGKASPPAEKQIRGDERFRTIFELANDIIVYIDTHGTIVDVNKRVEEILGYRPEEITGKNFTKMGVFGLKDAPRILKRFRDAVESGGVGRADREDRYMTQLEVRHKNGREVPVEASTTSVREGGELKGFVSIIRDLTERKRTEGTLQQVRESYRSLFDNSPIGIYRTTPDGRILMASPALVRMLGYSSFEQLAARNLEEEGFEPSYPRSQFKEIMDSKGEVLGLEAAWMKKDGSVIFVRENAKAIRDQKGDILCYEGTVEDITESKGAEEALKRERDFSRCILQTANSLILCLDADGAITVFNDECERVTGYRREEILGKRWADLFLPPDKRHPGLKSFAGWVRAHPQNRYEGPVVTKSGEVRTILWSNSSIVGSEPSDVTAIAIGCDITERKRAEKALGESEERFRRLYERAPLGYQSLDAEGCFIDVNQAWVDLFGYSRHQVIGHWFGDFLAPQEVEAFKRRFPRFIATGEVHVDVEMVQRAGSRIIVHIDGRISHDEHGEFKQTHCILHDITARKRTEQALRESEERHRTLFEGSLHPITIYDRDANIVMLNRVGAENLKRPLQEIIGKPLREFIPETHELTVKRVRQVLETGKPMFVEDEMPLPDGKRWFLSTLHPISDPRGQPDLVQVISYDITERKRGEQKLVESEELFSKAFRTSPNLMGITTLKEGRILDVNEAYCRATGYERDELVGHTTADFDIWADPEQRNIMMQKLGDGGRVRDLEVGLRTKYGDIRTLLFAADTMTLNEEPCLINVAVDITERKRAEEARRLSEDRLKKAQAIAHIGGWDWNIKENTLFWSDELYRIFGVDRRTFELSYESIQSLIHPDDIDSNNRQVKRFLENADSGEYSFRAVRPDGGIRHLSQIFEVVRDQEGTAVRAFGTIQDVTERKQAEDALQEERNKLQAIVDSMDYGLTIVDREHNITYQNEALNKMVGDHVGEKCYRAYEFREDVCDGCPVRMAWGDGESHTAERRVIARSGEIAFWENTTSPIRDARGEIVACLEITRNVTERKRAEEALRESERKYRDLVENINDVIYATDETGTLTYISPVIENIAGYKPSEVIGRNYLEFVHPEDKAAIVEGFEEIKTGKLSPSEYRVITKDNREVWIRTFSRPVFGEGRFVGLRGVMTDITERKRLFQQLIQSEKSAAVGTLAYGIAHEFNNILAGIMANAEYGLGIDDVKQVRECFKIIVENSQRGSSITNSLLAVAGEKERKRELADIRRPLENVLSFSLRELEKAGVRVIQDLKAVPEMFCDLGEFSGVFLNMINNARDAMTPGVGTLTVKIDHARDHIRIVFEDTGCGILEEIKDRIFDPFVTTKGALGKSEVPGTGLGLFVSRGIVDSYGGRIDVRSHPGKGTRFTITIPVTSNLPPESISREEIVSPKEIDTKLNILLIDDEKTICKVLKKFVESKGHQVTAFLEAEEGLKHFKEGKFDVVLSDITMPGMDGIELIKRIKEEDAHARIIAITGHVRQETLDRARKAGAQEILIKPFRSGELYDTILRLYQEAGQEGKTKGPAE